MVIKKIKVFWKVIYLVTVYLVSFSTGISLKKYHRVLKIKVIKKKCWFAHCVGLDVLYFAEIRDVQCAP